MSGSTSREGGVGREPEPLAPTRKLPTVSAFVEGEYTGGLLMLRAIAAGRGEDRAGAPGAPGLRPKPSPSPSPIFGFGRGLRASVSDPLGLPTGLDFGEPFTGDPRGDPRGDGNGEPLDKPKTGRPFMIVAAYAWAGVCFGLIGMGASRGLGLGAVLEWGVRRTVFGGTKLRCWETGEAERGSTRPGTAASGEEECLKRTR
jgi:hypothetical protein